MKCKEAQFCNIYIYLSVHFFSQNVAILISSDSKLHQVLSNVLKICSLIAYTSSMHEGVIESYNYNREMITRREYDYIFFTMMMSPSHPNPNPHVHMLLCDRKEEGKVDGMFHPNPADSPHLEMTRFTR